MPKSYDQYIRFKVIDRELRRWPSVKTSRLVSAISEFLDKKVSSRAIQKDIEAMRDDVRLGFLAPIEYDRQRKEYKYSDRQYSILNFNLGENEVKALKFYAECFSLYSQYSIYNDFSSAIQKVVTGVDIRKKISVSGNEGLIIQADTIVDSKGTQFITTFVDAVIEKQYVSFDYQKYTENCQTRRVLAPYLLKEYKNRWYVLGELKHNGKISTFALDRMSNLTTEQDHYQKVSSFNETNYFKHSFGIITLDDNVEEIVLQFSRAEAPYIRSLPIHPTQQILKDDDAGLTISINIIPSYEFYEYIKGKVPDVKVLSPAYLKDKIKADLEKGLSVL